MHAGWTVRAPASSANLGSAFDAVAVALELHVEVSDRADSPAPETHPAVRDAVCVGLPDERFGEVICAVVESESDGDTPDLATLSAHVRERLAAYKAPRHVVTVPSIMRAPNGKVDYKRLKALAIAETGVGAAAAG